MGKTIDSRSEHAATTDFVLLFALGLTLTPISIYLTFPNAPDRFQFEIFLFCFSVIIGLIGTIVLFRLTAATTTAKLHYVFQVIVRFTLAHIFITYGLSKLYGFQFPALDPSTLDKVVRDLSGQQFVWAFFGYSYGYSAFVGMGQALSAILLFFRKTQTLGAFILLPIITNIVVVNFMYDIPVKLYASLYLMMTLYLIATDWKRILALFWSNRSLPSRVDIEVSTKARTWIYVVKYFAILFILGFNFWLYESIT